MKYEPTGQIIGNAPGQASVSVGNFADERGEESNYLGAIRGGYYNPLKIIRTEKPVNEMVEAMFADALRVRNMLATKDASKVLHRGNILRFDCNYYVQRTANVYLRVTLVLLPLHALIFSNIYKTENSEMGWGAGVFGDTDYLALFAQKTLNETIDKAQSDPGVHRSDAKLSKGWRHAKSLKIAITNAGVCGVGRCDREVHFRANLWATSPSS